MSGALCTSPDGEPRGRGVVSVVSVVSVLFRAYRVAIAPAIGPACRYEPSCSHYAEQAIARFGLLRGAALGAWRLLRCHPFSRGGLDPVPTPPSRSGRR